MGCHGDLFLCFDLGVTNRALYAIGQAGFGTGCVLTGDGLLGMAQRGNYNFLGLGCK